MDEQLQGTLVPLATPDHYRMFIDLGISNSKPMDRQVRALDGSFCLHHRSAAPPGSRPLSMRLAPPPPTFGLPPRSRPGGAALWSSRIQPQHADACALRRSLSSSSSSRTGPSRAVAAVLLFC